MLSCYLELSVGFNNVEYCLHTVPRYLTDANQYIFLDVQRLISNIKIVDLPAKLFIGGHYSLIFIDVACGIKVYGQYY